MTDTTETTETTEPRDPRGMLAEIDDALGADAFDGSPLAGAAPNIAATTRDVLTLFLAKPEPIAPDARKVVTALAALADEMEDPEVIVAAHDLVAGIVAHVDSKGATIASEYRETRERWVKMREGTPLALGADWPEPVADFLRDVDEATTVRTTVPTRATRGETPSGAFEWRKAGGSWSKTADAPNIKNRIRSAAKTAGLDFEAVPAAADLVAGLDVGDERDVLDGAFEVRRVAE